MDNLKFFSLIPVFLLSFLVFVTGCNKDGEEEKEESTLEPIGNIALQKKYALPGPELISRTPYPWEKGYVRGLPRITKEFFRCKGGMDHLPYLDDKQGDTKVYRFDCEGAARHSLPVRDGDEFIYPILLELLNDIQEKTGCRVIVTCGHRCPEHNTYADPLPYNQTSKHQIGAEVDFYVEGYEQKPEEIIALLMEHYTQNPSYREKRDYREFLRLEQEKTDVLTPPLYNKEVLIKLYLSHEGRDRDNAHHFPYLSLQVRYDREKQERVIYTWEKGTKGFRKG